jgi:short subunit dehydrogenase-like uncharacterized protein
VTTVAIYGATGRTARLLARQAATRWPVVMVGRDPAGLAAAAAACGGSARWCVAGSDDADALRRAFAGARIVIQCAALSTDAAVRVAACSVAAGASYVDVCADASVAEAIAASLGDAPHRARVVVCPGVAPIGGALAEWLAVAALRRRTGELTAPESIELGFCSAGLARTSGSLRSALRMLLATPDWSTHAIDFPPPFAREQCFSFPLGCGRLAQLFPRAAIRTWAALAPPMIGSATTARALGVAHDLLRRGDASQALASALAPVLEAASAERDDAPERLRFAVVARVTAGGQTTAISAVGERPYATTVAMLLRVVSAILGEHGRTGIVGAALLVRAEEALDSLVATTDLRVFADAEGVAA